MDLTDISSFQNQVKVSLCGEVDECRTSSTDDIAHFVAHTRKVITKVDDVYPIVEGKQFLKRLNTSKLEKVAMSIKLLM